MVCDICNSPGTGTIISANQMREAVSRGFNPFRMGLVNNPAIMMVGDQAAYQHWRNMIVGQSASDWNICANCMAKLKPYLSEQSKTTASEASGAKGYNAQLTLTGHADKLKACAFSTDGARIVTASEDKTARVWDAATGAELAVLTGHADGLRACAFSPDGARIVTASFDKTARVWDASSRLKQGNRLWNLLKRQHTITLSGHTSYVRACTFSPDGTRIVTASGDKTARVWDAATGAELAVLSGHTNVLNACAFSPDGARIVTASGDKTARVWDAATGAELTVFTGHTNVLYACAFSPDGARIVTASFDDTARVWDAATGAELAVLTGHTNSVIACAFSPDGVRIFTASFDDTARVWDAASGAELAALIGHSNGLSACAFSPDGKRIVTTSSDETAKVWEMEFLRKLSKKRDTPQEATVRQEPHKAEPSSPQTQKVQGILVLSRQPMEQPAVLALTQQILDEQKLRGHAVAEGFIAHHMVAGQSVDDQMYTAGTILRVFSSFGGDVLNRTKAFPYHYPDGGSGKFFVLYDSR